MAFGSAAPEIIVNAVATIQCMNGGSTGDAQTTNLGVSAILGSGMIAFSLIPATCAFSSDRPLMLKRRPLLRDEGFYMLSLLSLIYVIWDGLVVFSECVMLLTVYVLYLCVVIFAAPVRRYYREVKGLVVNKRTSFSDKITVEAGGIDLEQPLLSPTREPKSAAEDATRGLLETDEEGDSDS